MFIPPRMDVPRRWLPTVLVLVAAHLGEAGDRGRDCWAGFEGAMAPLRGGEIACQDGEPGCDGDGEADGVCRVSLRVCVARADAGCRRRRVTQVRVRGADLALPFLPADLEGCGPPTTVEVASGAERRLALVARARGRRRPDRDRLRIRCATASCVLPCPANADGPDELLLVTRSSGSDLDLGWSGAFHNRTVPEGARLRLCLQGCDASREPRCMARPFAETCSGERAPVLPPLPLLAASVPTCLVTRFAAGAGGTGTANVQAGEVDVSLEVESAIFLGDEVDVCPRCVGGRCTSGTRTGRPCAVDGLVTVVGATPTSLLLVSRDCLPAGEPALGPGRHTLHLTTGESVLGSNQCATPPDVCPAGGACTAVCRGDACVSSDVQGGMGDHECVERHGGVSQRCCSTAPATPCLEPTVVRAGRTVVPEPPWPDPGYPKTAACEPGRCATLAATFCLPATGSAPPLDAPWDRPVPGAALVPVQQIWLDVGG
jgi:hypothetical protein